MKIPKISEFKVGFGLGLLSYLIIPYLIDGEGGAPLLLDFWQFIVFPAGSAATYWIGSIVESILLGSIAVFALKMIKNRAVATKSAASGSSVWRRLLLGAFGVLLGGPLMIKVLFVLLFDIDIL